MYTVRRTLRAPCAAPRNVATAGLAALWLTAVVCTSAATPAPLPQADSPAPTTQAQDKRRDTVVVEGERAALEHRVNEFVTSVTHVTSADASSEQESLRRWTEPVCPLVAGLGKEQGEFVLARISAVAREAHVPLGPEKCGANFYIVVTQHPETLIQDWTKHDRRAFGDYSVSQTSSFAGNERPIRAWYNVGLKSHDGTPLFSGSPFSLDGAMRGQTNFHATDSRMTFSDVKVLASVLVVVDAKHVTGLQYGQMADYIAMLGLAELNPNADLGSAPSILQLFAARGADQPVPAGLTTWDHGFLNGLYSTTQASTMQRAAITRVIVSAVDH